MRKCEKSSNILGGEIMADKTLVCNDCKQEFVFTEREQEFYSEKGFEEPKRCPECRKARKQQRNPRNQRY